jgi:hypothetical protein
LRSFINGDSPLDYGILSLYLTYGFPVGFGAYPRLGYAPTYAATTAFALFSLSTDTSGVLAANVLLILLCTTIFGFTCCLLTPSKLEVMLFANTG